MQSASLTQIRRQTNENYRKAIASHQPRRRHRQGRQDGTRSRYCHARRHGRDYRESRAQARYSEIAEDYAAVNIASQSDGELKIRPGRISHPCGSPPRHGCHTRHAQGVGQARAKEREFTALRSRNLTEAERTDARPTISPARWCSSTKTPRASSAASASTSTGAGNAGVNVTRSDGSKALLPFAETKKVTDLPPGKAGARRRRQAPHHQNGSRGKHGGGCWATERPAQ